MSGGIGLAETNHTRKWHIDSMNYLFFHRIQTLIEYNCYQSNQWFYSHKHGCAEGDLGRFVVLILAATSALMREHEIESSQ